MLVRVQLSQHIIRVDVVVMVTPVQIRRVATLPLHLIQQPARVVAAIARPATSPITVIAIIQIHVAHISTVTMIHGVV